METSHQLLSGLPPIANSAMLFGCNHIAPVLLVLRHSHHFQKLLKSSQLLNHSALCTNDNCLICCVIKFVTTEDKNAEILTQIRTILEHGGILSNPYDIYIHLIEAFRLLFNTDLCMCHFYTKKQPSSGVNLQHAVLVQVPLSKPLEQIIHSQLVGRRIPNPYSRTHASHLPTLLAVCLCRFNGRKKMYDKYVPFPPNLQYQILQDGIFHFYSYKLCALISYYSHPPDRRYYGSQLDNGSYVSQLDNGSYGSQLDNGSYVSQLDNGSYGSQLDNGSYVSQLDSGSYGSNFGSQPIKKNYKQGEGYYATYLHSHDDLWHFVCQTTRNVSLTQVLSESAYMIFYQLDSHVISQESELKDVSICPELLEVIDIAEGPAKGLATEKLESLAALVRLRQGSTNEVTNNSQNNPYKNMQLEVTSCGLHSLQNMDSETLGTANQALVSLAALVKEKEIVENCDRILSENDGRISQCSTPGNQSYMYSGGELPCTVMDTMAGSRSVQREFSEHQNNWHSTEPLDHLNLEYIMDSTLHARDVTPSQVSGRLNPNKRKVSSVSNTQISTRQAAKRQSSYFSESNGDITSNPTASPLRSLCSMVEVALPDEELATNTTQCANKKTKLVNRSETSDVMITDTNRPSQLCLFPSSGDTTASEMLRNVLSRVTMAPAENLSEHDMNHATTLKHNEKTIDKITVACGKLHNSATSEIHVTNKTENNMHFICESSPMTADQEPETNSPTMDNPSPAIPDCTKSNHQTQKSSLEMLRTSPFHTENNTPSPNNDATRMFPASLEMIKASLCVQSEDNTSSVSLPHEQLPQDLSNQFLEIPEEYRRCIPNIDASDNLLEEKNIHIKQETDYVKDGYSSSSINPQCVNSPGQTDIVCTRIKQEEVSSDSYPISCSNTHDINDVIIKIEPLDETQSENESNIPSMPCSEYESTSLNLEFNSSDSSPSGTTDDHCRNADCIQDEITQDSRDINKIETQCVQTADTSLIRITNHGNCGPLNTILHMFRHCKTLSQLVVLCKDKHINCKKSNCLGCQLYRIVTGNNEKVLSTAADAILSLYPLLNLNKEIDTAGDVYRAIIKTVISDYSFSKEMCTLKMKHRMVCESEWHVQVDDCTLLQLVLICQAEDNLQHVLNKYFSTKHVKCKQCSKSRAERKDFVTHAPISLAVMLYGSGQTIVEQLLQSQRILIPQGTQPIDYELSVAFPTSDMTSSVVYVKYNNMWYCIDNSNICELPRDTEICDSWMFIFEKCAF
ncbi:uncharacterized protein LOC144356248 [Saccoglossus kowalevskii]